jgi:hypothetical protein
MKNAFIKSRKNKIGNKAMLSKFAEFVSWKIPDADT